MWGMKRTLPSLVRVRFAARDTAAALIAAGVLLLTARPAHAGAIRQKGAPNFTNGAFGAGLQIGCPTGITVKLRLSTANSFQATGGFGCAEDFYVTGDYVLEMGNFFTDPHNLQLSWYLGVGGRYALDYHGYRRNGVDRTDVDLGPRVPIGMEFHFNQIKALEVYLEIAPGIDFVDDPGVTVDAGLGARIFF